MNYILAAIFSNLSFAIGDNVTGLLARKNKPLQLGFWSASVALAAFLIPALTIFSHELSNMTPANVAGMLAINVLVELGMLFMMIGMVRSSVTLTGVVAGSFPALTTILSLVFFGERVGVLQALAIAAVLIGVVLSSMHGLARRLLKDLHSSGAIFAFGAFTCWGVYFALVRIPIEQIGWFWPQYSATAVGILTFIIIAMFTKDRSIFKRPVMPGWLVLAALLGVGGGIFFNYAISRGPTAIVAPIAGSSPAVFVVLAYFIFREKLNRKQWVGIVLAVSGIISLSILST